MNENLIESTPARLISFSISEMPFAENARSVAGRLQHLRDCGRMQAHTLALQDRVGHAGAEFVFSGHQRGPGGSTGRADMKVTEPEALRVKVIEIRRLDNRISETS